MTERKFKPARWNSFWKTKTDFGSGASSHQAPPLERESIIKMVVVELTIPKIVALSIGKIGCENYLFCPQTKIVNY
jgi:hypothetical protein